MQFVSVSAHIAACELERQRAQDQADFARQLPLHVGPPVGWSPDEEEIAFEAPGWTSNY